MNGVFFINIEQSMYFSIQATNFRLKGNNNRNRGKILQERDHRNERFQLVHLK